jgi:hypothetical protein
MEICSWRSQRAVVVEAEVPQVPRPHLRRHRGLQWQFLQGGTSGSANPSSGTPTSSSASQGGNSQVPVMQQEAVQAMLVACISYYDESIPHSGNKILAEYCGDFMIKIGDALPNLLKPSGATSQPPSGSKQATTHKAATTSNPASVSTDAVKDLQQILLQDGDYQGPINGVYSPATIAAAYQNYLKKHPAQVPAR